MSVLFEPIAPELVESVKRGLLRLTPKQYQLVKLMLAGQNRDEMAVATWSTVAAVERLKAVIMAKCECTRYQFARACMELDSDPEVIEYLTALPSRRGRFRAMFAKT